MDFVGYCIGGQTYCLIYVYMPNGSLEDRLRCEVSYHFCKKIWVVFHDLVRRSSFKMKCSLTLMLFQT